MTFTVYFGKNLPPWSFLKDYLLHDYKSEIHEITNKTVSKDGRKRIFLDKNDLTNIYRHNRSPKTLFLAFLFFFIFEGTLRP